MSFGEIESVDLLPNGASVAVTAANKAEYVKLYVAHLLEGSVDRQFGAFQKGFLRLCSGGHLPLAMVLLLQCYYGNVGCRCECICVGCGQ